MLTTGLYGFMRGESRKHVRQLRRVLEGLAVRALKGDGRLIVTAVGAAQRAADFILDRNAQESTEGEAVSE